MPAPWHTALREADHAPLADALEALLAETPAAFRDAGEHFTCGEIEVIAELFRALGAGDAAARILAAHALSDNVLDDDPAHVALAAAVR